MRKLKLTTIVNDEECTSAETLDEIKQVYKQLFEDSGYDIDVLNIDIEEIKD